jgi:hypothetical protein
MTPQQIIKKSSYGNYGQPLYDNSSKTNMQTDQTERRVLFNQPEYVRVDFSKPMYDLTPQQYDQAINQMPAAGIRRLP